MSMIGNLERLLLQGRDDALLRFGLGSAYLKQKNFGQAIENLRRAVQHDPGYSAAWKLLGKAQAEAGDSEAAAQAYREGIQAAEGKGDIQAAKEMGVFLKRLEATRH